MSLNELVEKLNGTSVATTKFIVAKAIIEKMTKVTKELEPEILQVAKDTGVKSWTDAELMKKLDVVDTVKTEINQKVANELSLEDFKSTTKVTSTMLAALKRKDLLIKYKSESLTQQIKVSTVQEKTE